MRESRTDLSEGERIERGSPRLYKLWAFLSSALCLALAAYILARPAEREQPAGEADLSGAVPALQGTSPGAEVEGLPGAEPLPPELRDLPREWISQTNGPDHTGHAIRLDLERGRELLVERCRHRGYFDEARGEPLPDAWSFCEIALVAQVLGVESGLLKVRDRNAGELGVPIELSGTEPATRLTLEIEGARLELVPGSKNDLFQRLEAEPAIAAGKDQRMQYLHEREAARRSSSTPATPKATAP